MEKRISELNQTFELKDGCCFPIVQDGETKKVTFETLKNELNFEDLQSQIDKINNEWMGNSLFSLSDNTKSQKNATYTTTKKSIIVCSIGGGGADTGEYFARVVYNNKSICSVWMESGDVGIGNTIVVPKGVTLSFSVKGSTNRVATVEVFETN